MTAPIRSPLRVSGASVWPGLVALAALATLYLLTLQGDVSGSAHPYLFDVPQTQLVLNRWGTLHTTGYPLFVMLGAPVVALLRVLGVVPAAAASAVSLLWSLAALAVLFAIFLSRTKAPALAAALVAAFGLTQSVWLFSVVAEVYSLFALFLALSLYLALRDGPPWSRARWLAYAALLGLGAGHHRGMVLILPTLVVLLWPRFREAGRHLPLTLGLGTLVAAATFLVYLYLPLRAAMGARWVDGDVATWPGFLNRLFALESGWMANPPASLAELGRNALHAATLLSGELTWPGLAVGVAALVALFFVPGRLRFASALAAGLGVVLALNVWLPDFVAVGSGLMPAPLLLFLAFAEILAYAARQTPRLARVTLLAPLILALALAWRNYSFVTTEARDGSARVLIRAAAQFDWQPGDTLAVAGGPRYYALGFAQDVTGELPALPIVDHNDDFREILAGQGRLVTIPETFYVFPPSWWEVEIGGDLYLRSAGPDFVQIDDAPLDSYPEGEAIALDNGILLISGEVAPAGDDAYQLTLYWQAAAPPVESYSVYVHLTRADPPSGPGDVLAQADSLAPVAGWYPVTAWHPGEVVRDAYLITAPPGYDGPLHLRAGMYRPLDDGSFENFDAFSLSLN